MRILSLRFRNLNSLAGEWKIDFTNPEYVSSGIFAITGPTGAGKSTILDAICLALYGRTPRLERINEKSNEIMSRQTGISFSEVEFLSDKGEYRCTWSQNRAYNKSDGALQKSKQEIVDKKTGKVIESNKSRVPQKIIEVIGLDYPQFTRSILLAQGEFATFLDATEEKRAPILEKITGTEIYGQISIKVHERFSKEKLSLTALVEKAENTEMISAEQAEELQKKKLDHEQEIKELSIRCTTLETAVKWLDTLAELEKEIANLQDREKALVKRREAAKPDLESLSLARKAQSLEGIYAGLSALRGEQERDTAERTSYEGKLAELNAAYEQALETFSTAREKRGATLQEKEREEGIIRIVRELDLKIREGTKNRSDRTDEKCKLEETIRNYRVTIGSIESEIAADQAELLKVASYLESHAADRKLIQSLSGIEASFRNLGDLLEKREGMGRELHRVESTLADTEEIILHRKTDEDKVTDHLKKVEEDTDRARKNFAAITGNKDIPSLRSLTNALKDQETSLRSLLDLVSRSHDAEIEEHMHSKKIADLRNETAQISAHLANLQKEEEHAAQFVKLAEEKSILQAKVKSLEEERNALVSGKPCPLCGSTNHPWSNGTIPATDTHSADLESFRADLADLTAQIREIEKRQAAISAEVTSREAEREKLSTRITMLTEDIVKKSADLGLTITTSDPNVVIQAALTECTAQREAEQEILAKAETQEKQILQLENRVHQEKQALTGAQKESADARSIRDSLVRDRTRISSEIAANIAEYEKQYTAILDSLQDYEDILLFSPGDVKQVLPELTRRRNFYEENRSRKLELEKKSDHSEGELKKNRALLTTASDSCREVAKILSRIEKNLETDSIHRKELYGEKDPASEEKRITGLTAEAETAFALATDAKNMAEAQKTTCEEHISKLTGRIADRSQELEGKEQAFTRGLAEAGFQDETRFNAARIPDVRVSELAAMEEEIRREGTEVSSGLRDKTARLTDEREKALTTDTREKLAEEIGNLKNQTIRLQIDIGGLRTKLEQYDDQLTKFQKLTDEIAKQKKECAKWQNLHDLIGSADGKRFKVFAQGLTFENLVVQANRHLRKMSARYLLVRNRGSPLDLDIQDNYQAGEIRSTKNLSGGEQFLVSLSLALGLSGIASRNIRIDSLFLDEGFGTLDDTTLEMALETLSSLQREGKIIGIISHVPALKERIAVQIQVEKIGGGRSKLSGPGCSGSA